jgi:hypothetical protein
MYVVSQRAPRTSARSRPGRRALLGGLACLTALALSAGRAHAQGQPTFRGSTYEPFSGQIVVSLKTTQPRVKYKTLGNVNIRPGLDRAWSRVRGPLTNLLRQELGKGGRWNGQTAYNINVQLASRGQLKAMAFGSVGVQYILKGNRVTLTMTTPTIFGSWADPRFSIDFDVTLTLAVQARVGAPLKVTTASASVNAGRPQGANLSGDVLVAANSIISFFGGPDFLGRIQSQINARQFDASGQVNAALGPVNAAVSRLRLPNLSIIPYYNPTSQRLEIIFVQEQPQIPR